MSDACSNQGCQAPGHRRRKPVQMIDARWDQWVACVRSWLQEGVHPCSLTIDEAPGMSALSYVVNCSIHQDVEEFVALLLQHGAHPLRKDEPPAAPCSPMQYAVQLGKAVLVRMFYEATQPQPQRASDVIPPPFQPRIRADHWRHICPGEQLTVQDDPCQDRPCLSGVHGILQHCTPDGHRGQYWHTLGLVSFTLFSQAVITGSDRYVYADRQAISSPNGANRWRSSPRMRTGHSHVSLHDLQCTVDMSSDACDFCQSADGESNSDASGRTLK
jgi:hypothetical protein